jgi:MFS family permease
VLTAYTLPRSVLLIAGGVLGDRWGPRRILLTCYTLLAAVTLLLAVVVHLKGASVGLLLATGFVIGTVEAFALPAAGSFPRLFTRDDELGKALAHRGSVNQFVSLVGGPVSGVLVATTGLAGALFTDATTFAVAFTILLLIKPPYSGATRPEASYSGSVREGAAYADARAAYGKRSRAGLWRAVVREAGDGVRVAWGDPMLRALLLAVALVAGFVLPVTSLCVPLLVRARGWDVTGAGLVVGAAVAGGLVVTLLVARLGTFDRPGIVVAAGPSIAALGMTGLALGPSVVGATVAALIQGIGVGLFTSHLAPMFVASTPPTHLTRLQSLLVLAQTVPLLGSTNLVGAVAASSARLAILTCAGGTALAGITLLAVRRVRTAVG